jgi:hypothetical protein
MRCAHHLRLVIALTGCLAARAPAAGAFEGRINAVTTLGSQTNALLYTVGADSLRVELTATNWPNPVDILDRNSGALTLLFPNNRSFVHLPPATEAVPAVGTPDMPMPSASLPPGVGPRSAFVAPAMPAMPAMPMMPGAKLELHATEQTTNLLGFTCRGYELKQRGETMEIWATDQLFPFQPYVKNQSHRFTPRMIEAQWAEMVQAQKLFPLLATLKSDQGREGYRFEVQSVTPQKLTDEDAKLFQPPPDYQEIQPLPF